jgi:hypothetical protein
MQGMICTQRRNVELLLGKIISPTLWEKVCEIIAQSLKCKIEIVKR